MHTDFPDIIDDLFGLPIGSLLFYTTDDEFFAYDLAVDAAEGTLIYDGDVAGMPVYFVPNYANASPDGDEEYILEPEENLLADISGKHRELTTAEYLDDLVDGNGENVVIVIDRADEFFTKDGFRTLECVADWAAANGALVVVVQRREMISRAVN